MDKKEQEQENERQKYLSHLMALAEEDCHGTFKEAIKLRLCGNHKELVKTRDHGDIISPALTSDEYEENQLIVYAYKLLKKANNKEAVNCLREVVVELLKTALPDKNNITYVDELCYLMASLEMEESSELAEDLGKSMWSRLETCGNFGKLILSDDKELSYIHRTFDVWLTVTSTSQHNAQLQQLFEGNIACVKDVSAMQLKFLLLIFRALVKFDQYFAGNVAFYKLHEKLVKNLAYISSFNNLCWELGILIRRTEGWLEPFIKGLNEAEISLKENALKSAIFIDALNRMKLTPSGRIGFVLTFNKIANRLIGEVNKFVEGRKKELERLNNEGIIVTLFEVWQNYVPLLPNVNEDELLEPFIKKIVTGNWVKETGEPPSLVKHQQRQPEVEHFENYMWKIWFKQFVEDIKKQPLDASMVKRTSDNSGICFFMPNGLELYFDLSVKIYKFFKGVISALPPLLELETHQRKSSKRGLLC